MSSFADFESMTGQARRAIWLAYREAERLGHDFVATEHLLAGLLRDGAGEMAAVLREQAIEPADVLLALERSLELEPVCLSTLICITPRVVRALAAGAQLARTEQSRRAGPAHLLRAMFADPENMTRAFLDGYGFDCEKGGQALRRLALDPDRDVLVHKGGVDVDRVPLDPTAAELRQLLDGRWPTDDRRATNKETNISAQLKQSVSPLADRGRSEIEPPLDIEKPDSFRLHSNFSPALTLVILIAAIAAIGIAAAFAARWRM